MLDQQRRRLVDERPRVLMPSRLAVPEAPLLGSHQVVPQKIAPGSHLVVPQTPIRSQVYAPEAPRPHVVRLDLDNNLEEDVQPVQPETKLVHHRNPAPVVATHRAPLQINRGPPVQQVAPAVVQVRTPEAPRPHVGRLEQQRRVSPVVRLEQPPVVRVEQRVEQIAPIVRVEQAPVRVHSTPRFQPSSLQVKPSAEDLTFLISKQITQSIRERIPTILSNLKAKQSKQTKVVQAPVTVTHTVTSTSSSSSSSSSTAKKSPSHHYVQNSIIGQEQRKKVEKKEDKAEKKMMEMEEMKKNIEEEEIILPQPAPILVEDTREHKPVWTVTRQRPRQTTVKPRKKKTQVQHSGHRIPSS